MSRKKGSKNKIKKGLKKIIALDKKIQEIKNESPVKASIIKASIKTDKWYYAEGSTEAEAITNLKPEFVKSKGVLVLENNGMKREKILPQMTVFRAFGPLSPLMKSIALKQVFNIFSIV